MRKMLKKKFPIMKQNITIWFSKIESVIYKNNKRFINVNKDGSKILFLCDGKTSIESIVKKLTEQKNFYEINLKKTIDFLTTLEKLDVIYLSESPIYATSTAYKKGDLEKIFPFHVTLELTNKCNFKCRYCYNNSSPANREEITSPIKLLEELKENGVWSIELSGGEPFLHSSINDILEFALENFGMIGILTNGTLINEEVCRKVKKFSDKVVFQVCLDSSNPLELEKITNVKDSFNRILKAMRLLRKNGLIYRVGMVVDDPKRIEEMEEVLKFAKKEGASAFVANIVLNFGRGENQIEKFRPEDYLRFWEKIKELTFKYPDMFRTEILDKVEEYKNCGAGSRDLVINWKREVKICVLSEHKVGKLEGEGAYKTFLDENQEVFEKFAQLNAPDEKICKNCDFLNYCYKCVIRGLRKARELGFENCLWVRQEMDKIGFLMKGGEV